jgi:hypothetical protein
VRRWLQTATALGDKWGDRVTAKRVTAVTVTECAQDSGDKGSNGVRGQDRVRRCIALGAPATVQGSGDQSAHMGLSVATGLRSGRAAQIAAGDTPSVATRLGAAYVGGAILGRS